MKKWLFSILIIFILCTNIYAGDIATFVNLGFSENCNYFMFGQYGIEEQGTKAYAEFFIVDVYRNEFVSEGVKKRTYSITPEPGNDGRGALFSLVAENYNLIRSYNINHLATGRFLYILVDGEVPKQNLEFRDFNTNKSYDVSLFQSAYGSGKDISASFYIKTSVTSSAGNIKNYTIGRPDYKRTGVREYQINYILLSPDAKSLVIVVEKEMIDTTGSNIRYMVETAQL